MINNITIIENFGWSTCMSKANEEILEDIDYPNGLSSFLLQTSRDMTKS